MSAENSLSILQIVSSSYLLTTHLLPLALPSAIIFDCDGTLADTMPVHYEAWAATLARYPGLELSEDRFYILGGWPTLNIAELLKKGQAQP